MCLLIQMARLQIWKNSFLIHEPVGLVGTILGE